MTRNKLLGKLVDIVDAGSEDVHLSLCFALDGHKDPGWVGPMSVKLLLGCMAKLADKNHDLRHNAEGLADSLAQLAKRAKWAAEQLHFYAVENDQDEEENE